MQFVGPMKRIHSLDAKEAVRTGIDPRRLVLAAFRYSVGELTDHIASPGNPLVPLQGPERQRMLEFFEWVGDELSAELTGGKHDSTSS